jgi:hypothetical protein
LLCCGDLGSLARCQACDEPTVNGLLAAPGVDRLAADAQVAREVGDLPPSTEEIEDSSTELRWIPASAHGRLLCETAA